MEVADSQLAVAEAQREQAVANQRTVEAQYQKMAKARAADVGAVSKDALDTAENQYKSARASADLAQRQEVIPADILEAARLRSFDRVPSGR